MHYFDWLASTWDYFNQIITLSSFPTSSFNTFNWVALRDLLLSVLSNPFFYGVIWIILIMTILPTVDDD